MSSESKKTHVSDKDLKQHLVQLQKFNAENKATPGEANTWGLTEEHKRDLGVPIRKTRSLEDVMAELESLNSASQG